MANERDLRSGEHLGVDSTLIQAWAGHKSFVREDASSGNFKGKTCCNDTHAFTTGAGVRLYRR